MSRRTRKWSAADLEVLSDYAARGRPIREAAAAFGVSRNAVISAANRAGIVFDPDPEIVREIVAAGVAAYWAERRAA